MAYISGLSDDRQDIENATFPPPRYDPPPSYSSLFQEVPLSGQNHHQPSSYISTQPTRSAGTVQGQHSCSRELESLRSLDYLLVLQDEGSLCSNKVTNFIIKDGSQKTLYYACEDTICCSADRAFEMAIYDMRINKTIIQMSRSNDCCITGSPLEVSAPPGNVIGIVDHMRRIFSGDILEIMNSNSDVVLKIKCPVMTGVLGDNVFHVKSADGNTQIGKITKIQRGLMREMFIGCSYNFEITFPSDLDVHMKAVILAACFLIKVLFYEPDN